MSNLKLQEYGEYAYGLRGVLQPGDKFRVSGGPFYQNDDGTKTSMAERGTFVFRRYCEKGASKWIEATRVGGENVVLSVGKAVANRDLPSFKAPAVQGQEGHREEARSREETGGRPSSRCRMRGQAKGGQSRRAQGHNQGPGRLEDQRGQRGQTAAQTQSQIWVYPAKVGSGPKRGKNGVPGAAGRGKSPPSTSGSTLI